MNEEKFPSEQPPLDDESKAFNKIFHQEEKKIGEMHIRFNELQNALYIFDKYLGEGLAYEMPLNEVIGFLESKDDGEELDRTFEREAINTIIKKFDNGLTGKSHLVELIDFLEEDKKKIMKIIKGEDPEIDLASE